MRGWLYRDIIFSLLAIFGEGVIISWHHIFTHDNIGEGVIISWHYIFTPDNILWGGDMIFLPLTILSQGGDYIVTLYFRSWQYLVRGWIYRDIIFSLLIIFGEGVIISWHYNFTPGNIWWGDDYIVTLHFHSWQYLVRGWWYRDIFSLLKIFGEGVNISWHYIFTPDNIWWGGDYIVTLYFHSWQYLVRGWLYCDITFSLLTIFGQGVMISWHIFTTEDIWWGGEYIVTLYFHSW